MKINSSPIISADSYNQDTTLNDDIQYLSDSKNAVTDQSIINIVTKYLFCYYYLNSINIKVPFSEVIHFFDTINTISTQTLQKEEIVQNLDNLNGFYHAQDYSLRMAMDIASTVDIFKDIISRNIDKDPFEWRYLWMDLWSWTWVLTLAQFIQAKRNNFDNITNIWFDLWYYTSIYSKRILELLDAWTVKHQDTTQLKLFHHIPQYQDITFITNETLCDPYLPINWNRKFSDPFFENNENIFSNWKVFLNEHTQFFPEEVWVEDRMSSANFLLDKENWFSYKNEWADENWIFCFTDILVWWNFIRLEDTWKELKEKWLVNQLPNLSPRWCINR